MQLHKACKAWCCLAMYKAQLTSSVYFLVYTSTYLMRPASTAVRCATLFLIKHQAHLSALAPLMQFKGDSCRLRPKLPKPSADVPAERTLIWVLMLCLQVGIGFHALTSLHCLATGLA